MLVSCASPFSQIAPSPQGALKICFATVSVAATLLNLAIIGLFYMEKSLQTFSNAIYVSLAICDLLIGCVLAPLTTAQLSFAEEKLCFVNKTAGIAHILLAISALTVSAIAYDRLQRVTKAQAYEKFMTRAKKTVLIVAPWILPLLFIPARFVEEKMIAWLVLCAYAACYFLLLASYARLTSFLGKHVENLGTSEGESGAGTMQTAIVRRNRKANRLILLIVIVFIACTSGVLLYRIFEIANFYKSDGIKFFKNYGPAILAIGHLMFQLNSALNPITYFAKHQDFKRALRKLLCTRRNDAVPPNARRRTAASALG